MENLIIKQIDPNNVSDRHINQLTELTCTTGYFQYVNLGKKDNFDHKARVKNAFVIPYLPYTKVILDELDNIAGYYIALTKAEDDEVATEDFSKYTNPDDVTMFKGFVSLYEKIDPKSFILNFFAVRYDLHGLIYPKYNQKIADILFEQILKDFKQSNCQEMVLITWEKFKAANKFYKKHGGTITDIADLSNTIYNDRFLLVKFKS